MSIKIALIDNDQVVRAEADLAENGHQETLETFLRKVKEELVTGQTAYLEIEDSKTDTVTFEIAQFG